jgi:hypothetical protein
LLALDEARPGDGLAGRLLGGRARLLLLLARMLLWRSLLTGLDPGLYPGLLALLTGWPVGGLLLATLR